MVTFSKYNVKRFAFMILAIVIISFGVTLLKYSNFGTDPFNCMNIGISSHIPIGYGTYQLIVNVVLFIPLVVLKPSIFGAGAITNMFFSAYFVEFFCSLAEGQGLFVDTIYDMLIVRIMLLIAGVVSLCFGAALYMECDLGTAAYDALGVVIEEKTMHKIKYKYVRIATDILCICIGYLSGSTVGIGTIIGAFFTGPLISYFRNRIIL